MSLDGSGLRGLPERLGRYELKGLLGRGGMGRVVRAFDPVLRREVALKLVETGAADAEALRELRFLFHREARATAQLEHPNVVQILDYSGPDAELPFIACELIDGRTLGAILDERGALPVNQAAALGYEISQGLAHAHQAGIVHRDLKPDNVFWRERDGRVVLADFGLAKAFDGPGDARLGGTVRFGTTSLFGSPAYMAPELLGDAAAGPKSDLYALGALLFEALTGAPAFAALTLDGLLEKVQKGLRAPWPPGVSAPPKLLELVEALLSPRPEARPESAALVGHTLRQVLDGLGVSDPRLLLAGSVASKTPAGSPPAPSSDTAPTQVDRRVAEPEPATEIIPPRPKRRRPWLRLVALGLWLGIAYLAWQSAPPEPAASGVTMVLKSSVPRQVWIDSRDAGTVQGALELSLPAGRHVVESALPGSSERSRREILLIEGTSPTFELP